MRGMIRAAWVGVTAVAGEVIAFASQAQSGFVKVPDDQLARQETLPAAPLVFLAYAFAWVAILVYLFALWRRVGRVERELADVSERLRDRPRTRL